MKPLKILEQAEIEFRDTVTWYRDRDPRVADRFAAETRKTLELIERFPQIGSRVYGIDDPDVRGLPVHTFPSTSSF